jgi:hypothetical protein
MTVRLQTGGRIIFMLFFKTFPQREALEKQRAVPN